MTLTLHFGCNHFHTAPYIVHKNDFEENSAVDLLTRKVIVIMSVERYFGRIVLSSQSSSLSPVLKYDILKYEQEICICMKTLFRHSITRALLNSIAKGLINNGYSIAKVLLQTQVEVPRNQSSQKET